MKGNYDHEHLWLFILCLLFSLIHYLRLLMTAENRMKYHSLSNPLYAMRYYYYHIVIIYKFIPQNMALQDLLSNLNADCLREIFLLLDQSVFTMFIANLLMIMHVFKKYSSASLDAVATTNQRLLLFSIQARHTAAKGMVELHLYRVCYRPIRYLLLNSECHFPNLFVL